MATARYPQTAPLPTLSAAWVRMILEKSQDLALVLDRNGVVIDALQTDSFPEQDVGHWIGQPLRSVVGPESLIKIDLLLSNDIGVSGSDARWRHINLVGVAGVFFPVLARFIILKSEVEEARIVFLRDLRSVTEASDRFVSAQREIESVYNEKLQELQEKIQNLNARLIENVSVDNVLSKVVNKSFDNAIAETMSALERQCLKSILVEAGGSHAVAAQISRMSLSDWMEKIAKYKM